MVGANRTNNTANRRPPAAEPPLGEDLPGPSTFVCELCRTSFSTKSGLGLHYKRSHPVEANRAVGVDRVKARWSEEEMRLMAKAEADYLVRGLRTPINQYLVGLFPHRTLEAIKGKRRDGVNYRPLVRGYVASQQAAPPEEAASQGDPSQDEEGREQQAAGQPRKVDADWREAFREELNRLCRSTDWEPLGIEAGALYDFVQRACAGEQVAEAMLVWVTQHCHRTEKDPPRTIPPRVETISSSRKRKRVQRREEYRRIQGLYRKNPRAAVDAILGGEGSRGSGLPVPQTEFREYWQRLLEEPSIPLEDLGVRPDPAVTHEHLWGPISVEEIGRCEVKRGTAPGPDGISAGEWGKIPRPVIALLFNTILLGGQIPSSLQSARTVFIPKGCPRAASDFRPITITSVILRHLHRILACRLTATPGLVSERQKAFRPGVDGIAENIGLLSGILTESRRKIRTVHLASLDVTKAFDTVSHDALIDTCERAGMPRPFVEYLRTVYEQSWTTLEVGAHSTRRLPVRPGRGVKQGDPLSPILFCMVIERALEKLDEAIGFDVFGHAVNAIAFADDVVLVASTSRGLQRNLELFCEELRRFGLIINPSKSRALSMVASGKQKKVKVFEESLFTVGDRLLPQTSPIELWRYLGIPFEGIRLGVAGSSLRKDLERLTKAPLKPQQRLHILRTYVLPKYMFAWTFGRVSAGFLRTLDAALRKVIRLWLHLPNDTPTGYYHAPTKSGGLGVPQLTLYVPFIRHQRLSAMGRSSDGAVRALVNSSHFQGQLEWCRRLLAPVLSLELGLTFKALERVWSGMLHGSVDGGPLRDSDQSRLSTDWLRCGTRAIPARDYVHYHQVHINAIPSRVRTSRGRRNPDPRQVMCRAGCRETETAAHVIQKCFRTHGGRILRHDHLVMCLARWLRELGYRVVVEEIFDTVVGRRKPDVIAVRNGRAVVIDAQVVAASFDLEVAHRNKIRKYAVEAQLAPLVAAAHAVHAGGNGLTAANVSFTSLTISWRGVWSRTSAESLLELGLPAYRLRQLTTMTLWGSWMNWRRFNSMTISRMGGRWNLPEGP